MRKLGCFLFLAGMFYAVQAQSIDILVHGGYVIDPKNDLHDTLDIAIKDGRILRIDKHIDPRQAVRVVNATGMYVTPGLIDIHTHVFFGTDPNRSYCGGTEDLVPDEFTFRAGLTTVVDAGSSGWRDFPVFKQRVIDHSQTRVLAFLNIVGAGMRGSAYEQNIRDMDAEQTAQTVRNYPDYIVGIKVAHYSGHSWAPVDAGAKAARLANIPVMVDFGSSTPLLPVEELLLKHLHQGDIFTHCFAEVGGREPVVDPHSGRLKPFVRKAQQKGIVFDVGYGEISFAFSQAIPAIKSGFMPNSLSTDIHARDINGAMKDLLNVMSQFMALGMDMPSVIKSVTWNPAREIRHEELGNLSPGVLADMAIFSKHSGRFGFFDHTGYKIEGRQKLECEMTIREGKIVYDLNGLGSPLSPKK